MPHKFVNLTPHAITIDGIGTLPPSGVVARAYAERVAVPAHHGIRVFQQDLGRVHELPAPVEGTTYIVSSIVLASLLAHPEQADRAGVDVFAPDTGSDAHRERGSIVGVRGLVY